LIVGRLPGGDFKENANIKHKATKAVARLVR